MKYKDLKKYIYKLDPETAHTFVEAGLRIVDNLPILKKKIENWFSYKDSSLSQEIFGITFPNPVGLAAGFDKNATMLSSLESLGFGFIEFGTVTPKPQIGNSKPRIFRFPEYNSIQNAMGFNNAGMEKVKENIRKAHSLHIPIIANIGKNKATSTEDALNDYKTLINGFNELCELFVVNISSPNTPSLRTLQNESFIKEIFSMASSQSDKPILLKISPDIDINSAIKICETAILNGADGIVATNTTTDYSLLPVTKNFGGLSGEVLKEKSFMMLEALCKEFFGRTVLISVGGISNAEEAYRRLKAGASLIEIYSALIFEGPTVVGNINQEIVKLMKRDGFSTISDVVGSDRK